MHVQKLRANLSPSEKARPASLVSETLSIHGAEQSSFHGHEGGGGLQGYSHRCAAKQFPSDVRNHKAGSQDEWLQGPFKRD